MKLIIIIIRNLVYTFVVVLESYAKNIITCYGKYMSRQKERKKRLQVASYN